MMPRRIRDKKSRRGGSAKGSEPETAADFSFGLSRVAVSQICRSMGFRYAESSAVETLTLVAIKYLQTLACTTASFSNSASRTESNIFDIVNALHDLHLPLGFPGGSAVVDPDATKSCSMRSGVLRDLSDFVDSTPEIPFAKPVPRAINKSENLIEACQAKSPQRRTHIPNWLPDFPDASTCKEISLPPRSEKLWEISNCVLKGSECENLSTVSCSGSSGGFLPEKRKKVRFKFGRSTTVNGGACKGGNRSNANGSSELSTDHEWKKGRLRTESQANGYGVTE